MVVKVLGNQAKGAVRGSAADLNRLQEQAPAVSSEQIARWIEALARLENQLKTAANRRILIEVAVIRLGGGTYTAEAALGTDGRSSGAEQGTGRRPAQPDRLR